MSASQNESAGFFVPGDTIVDLGRVLRKPVKDWAFQLLVALRACLGKGPRLETVERGCGALNNAALLFVYASQPEVAAEICHSHLRWIDGFRAVLSEAELSVLAIQPWVNLGRLSRRSRDYDRALQYFLALDLGGLKAVGLPFGGLQTAIPGFVREAAEPIYVYETLRTYLQSEDFDRAIDFANDLGKRLLPSSFMLRTELLMHVLLRQGEAARFVSLMKEMPWPEDQFGVLAKHFYTSVALNAIGQSNSCAKALSQMMPHVISSLSSPVAESRDLRLAIEVCRLSQHLGLRELFLTMLQATCAAVLRAGDVPFAHQLQQMSKQEPCFAMLRELIVVEEFVADSDYTAFSRKPLRPEISEILTELRSVISQLIGNQAIGLCA
jgi:hypothetical protein